MYCDKVLKKAFHVYNGTHCYDTMKCKALCEQAFIHTLTIWNIYVINTSTIGVTFWMCYTCAIYLESKRKGS